MATISSLGLSGLPLNDLLADLRKVEEAPLGLLEQRQAAQQSKISAYGKITNALEVFEAAANNLSSEQAFTGLKTTSSNESVFTATAPKGSPAVAGSYQIHVETLASTQSLATAGQASREDALSASGGALTFTLGDGSTQTLVLTAEQTSLEGVRAAINEADIGFTATLLNNGSDTTPHQLVLSTTDTGTDARVALITSDNADLSNVLGYDETVANRMTQVAEALDAKVHVNGITLTSGSNTLADAIEGLTLELKSINDATSPDTLTVAHNTEGIRRSIDSFVSAYNSLLSTVRGLSSYDAENNQANVLTGDIVARSVESRLSAALNSVSPDGEFGMLWEIGISTRVSDGSLQVDSDKLNDAIRNNRMDVAQLFSGEGGLIGQIKTAIEGLSGTRGLLTNATEGAKSTISTIQEQYERTQNRIDQKMASYQRQFVDLERYMSEMNGISSYLTSQLNMLENLSRSNRDK